MPSLWHGPKNQLDFPTERPLSRSEVYRIVGKRTGYRQPDVDYILDTFLQTLVDALKNSDTMTFKGIGKFEHLLFPPRIRWDRTVGDYRMHYPGRTFQFVPTPEVVKNLREKFARDFPIDIDTALNNATIKHLKRLLIAAEQRAEKGEYVAPETLPKLRRTLQEVSVRRKNARFNKL